MLSLKIDPEKCDGCGRCTVACSMSRVLSKEQDVAGPYSPLLWVNETGMKYSIDICRHCEKPVCVDACVAGVITRNDENGIIQIDTENCIGCWSCVMECPFKALRIENNHAVKCDGCRELKTPLCVRFCPTGALKAASDSRETALQRRRERIVIR